MVGHSSPFVQQSGGSVSLSLPSPTEQLSALSSYLQHFVLLSYGNGKAMWQMAKIFQCFHINFYSQLCKVLPDPFLFSWQTVVGQSTPSQQSSGSFILSFPVPKEQFAALRSNGQHFCLLSYGNGASTLQTAVLIELESKSVILFGIMFPDLNHSCSLGRLWWDSQFRHSNLLGHSPTVSPVPQSKCLILDR